MKLGDAITRFLDHARLNDSNPSSDPQHASNQAAMLLLTECFSADEALADITRSSLRDFLSRWYLEKAHGSQQADSASAEQSGGSASASLDMLDSIEQFFSWTDNQNSTDQSTELAPVLNELRHSLPRALQITNLLSDAVRAHGGAFTFPEFLTSFEEGGSSQYDIDVPGSVGAIDGYFRIARIEGRMIEAEELISEERVWPIVFPQEVAEILDTGYILNLELVRKPAGWQITGCGFAFPPGTDIS
jgi:hypothetical protein